jgi:hypothetical protein
VIYSFAKQTNNIQKNAKNIKLVLYIPIALWDKAGQFWFCVTEEEMTEYEFYKWFEALDLGDIEHHRACIAADSVENAYSSRGTDWECAKNTALMIVDTPGDFGFHADQKYQQ